MYTFELMIIYYGFTYSSLPAVRTERQRKVYRLPRFPATVSSSQLARTYNATLHQIYIYMYVIK